METIIAWEFHSYPLSKGFLQSKRKCKLLLLSHFFRCLLSAAHEAYKTSQRCLSTCIFLQNGRICAHMVVLLCVKKKKNGTKAFVSVLWSFCVFVSVCAFTLNSFFATFGIAPIIASTSICPAFHQVLVSSTCPLAQSLSACVQWCLV